MDTINERRFQLGDLLALKIMGWSRMGNSLRGAYWDEAMHRSRLLIGSPLHLQTGRLRPGSRSLWRPWDDIADAWPLHRQMCARDPEVKARYLHTLANLMLARYGPPSIWTAPLEVLEPADICDAALLALAPDDAEVKAALELPDAALRANLTLPDGVTPAQTLVQPLSSPFPQQQLTGDSSSPEYVRLTYQTTGGVGDNSQVVAGALYLDEAGVRVLLGQLRLWLGRRENQVARAVATVCASLDTTAAQALHTVITLLPPLTEVDGVVNTCLATLIHEVRADNRAARGLLLQLPARLAAVEPGVNRAAVLAEAVAALAATTAPEGVSP